MIVAVDSSNASALRLCTILSDLNTHDLDIYSVSKSFKQESNRLET